MEIHDDQHMLSVNEYAQYVGSHPRTVKRWIAAGKLPAAAKDPFNQEWRIPRDAVPMLQAPAPAGGAEVVFPGHGEVALHPQFGQQLVGPGFIPMHEGEPEPTRTEILEDEGSFLTVRDAARYLNVPADVIREHPEDFGAKPWGVMRTDGTRALMVPKATILAFDGRAR